MKNAIQANNRKFGIGQLTLTLGILLLNLTASAFAVAPSNDNFADAATLAMSGNSISVNSTNTGATKETGEPNHAENAGGSSVWFKLTPNATKVARIRTAPATFDTMLAVYTGTSVNNLTHVSSNGDCADNCGVNGESGVDVLLTAGQTYYIAVDGVSLNSPAQSGTFTLSLSTYNAPLNDNLANASYLGISLRGSIAGTNYNATRQPDEPNHYFTGGKSVWYRWTPTGDFSAYLEITDNYQSQMAVYTASVSNPAFNQLTKIIANYNLSGDGTSYRTTFFAEQGKTYYIAVDGMSAASDSGGNFQLKFGFNKLSYSARFRQTSPATSLSVFRPGDGTWYSLLSLTNAPFYKQFGMNGDKPVPADYDGDGRTDQAVARSENGKKVWYISPGYVTGYFYAVQWGLATDKAVTGDFDNDGRADFTVIRNTSSGWVWYVRQSSNGALLTFYWGRNGDKPVMGDFDGDGATDAAVVRPVDSFNAVWYILKSGYGSGAPFTQMSAVQFGYNADKLVPEDYDGDGRTDIAVWRGDGSENDGNWFILRSSDNQLQVIHFGMTGDKPQPGDYNGDGRAEPGIFRPSNGTWYTNLNPLMNYGANQWGTATDIPVSSMATLAE